MASLGQLTAGIAHEIKNPLNFVNNFAEPVGRAAERTEAGGRSGLGWLDENSAPRSDEVVAMLTSNLEKITEHGKRADGIVKACWRIRAASSGEWRRSNSMRWWRRR